MDTFVSKSHLLLPALLRMISFAHKAGHLDRVAEAGLELKEEQSSRNERQKHATQKICQERLWRQPPKPCLCELHCFRGTYGYKHINHDT